MTTAELEKLSIAELTELLHKEHDGNSGEILNGFREMRITGPKLKAALVRYLTPRD